MRALPLLAVLLSGCAGPRLVTRGDLQIHTFTHEDTNAHLVVKDGQAFLFDAGYERNAAKLEADIRAAGVDPARLKAVLIGHAHADHAGGARHFHQAFGTPVVVGQGDEGMFKSGTNEPLCPTDFIGRSRKAQDESATYTGSEPDVVVDEPVELQALTGIEGKVLRLPGHTNGSLVVVVGDVALVSDLLRGSIIGSGAETHFYQCDLALNRANVVKVLDELAPGAQLYFVGHFGPVTRASVSDHFR